MLSIFNLSGGTAQSGRSHCSIQAEPLLNFAGRADFAERRTHLDYRQDPCRDVFTCRVCGWPVGPQAAGTQHRNHCPNCLASVHLDDEPGDRAADCGGTMEPVAVWVRKGGEWAIIHRCKICGVLHSNRVAADDNPTLLMSLAVKPLAAPPFPLDRLERAAE